MQHQTNIAREHNDSLSRYCFEVDGRIRVLTDDQDKAAIKWCGSCGLELWEAEKKESLNYTVQQTEELFQGKVVLEVYRSEHQAAPRCKLTASGSMRCTPVCSERVGMDLMRFVEQGGEGVSSKSVGNQVEEAGWC
jgi:hypothetical protein